MSDPVCAKCGAVREGSYVNDSYCKACRSNKGKEAREKARLAKGKEKKNDSGRSPNCSKCKKEKEPGRDNESYCKTCKSEASKLRRAAKRLESGLRPLGSGPNPVCSCGSVKENLKARECNACHRKRDNEWRLRTGRTKKHRTGLCACGQPFAPYSKCYCRSCLTVRARNYLQSNPEYREKTYARNRKRKVQSYEEFIKYQTRYTTGNAIKSGILIKQPCEVCGTIENIEAHHDDYTKPYDIRWLCRTHHNEHHHPLKETENQDGTTT